MTKEELLLSGLRAGIELQKRDLTVTEKEAKVKTITNDLQIDGESPTLTEDLADMVLDIIEVAACSGINLHGTVLQRISERNRNK